VHKLTIVKKPQEMSWEVAAGIPEVCTPAFSPISHYWNYLVWCDGGGGGRERENNGSEGGIEQGDLSLYLSVNPGNYLELLIRPPTFNERTHASIHIYGS